MLIWIHEKSRNRPVEFGPFPFEVLCRDDSVIAEEAKRPPSAINPTPFSSSMLGKVAQQYSAYFKEFCEGDSAPEKAPVPDSLVRRSRDIKGAIYYFDGSHAGICKIPPRARLAGQPKNDHQFAVAISVAYGRLPEADNLAKQWLEGAEFDVAHLRATEISTCIAGYIRALGFGATAHVAGHGGIDLDRIAVLAGIAERDGDQVRSPFLGEHYALAVVTTDYAMAIDSPLGKSARVNGLKYWLGINGAVSGREQNRQSKRSTHLSRYPMEQVKRVERPTTLIIDDEVPRVPKRANFFMRARAGDLGERAQREVSRFATKHPITAGMISQMQCLVPHQEGQVADVKSPELSDPAQNARALKSLAYHMGADLVGICEVPRYAWYSHHLDGEPIQPYHRYAIVMLIDQGYATMEGASGDDWISGCQSMRGYLRGAEIAGVMSEFLRRKGCSARPHTQADSDVLHIPLVLWAGLGELSRIGELVLNPYVGPRFKSVVLTTDLPLEVDKPIDFGLQYFCSNCLKCARECPVNALPFGDKVMFNAYEIWKPDVERCARYRITNQKGSACGRCMKTCPLNKVVSADGSVVHRVGTWLGVNARWLKPVLVPLAVFFDDWFGYGTRNSVKQWWLNLEVVDGVCVIPKATNERDIDITRDTSGKKTPVGYYSASVMPHPNARGSVPANHKGAVERAAELETVEEAKQRIARGGERPAHYIPTLSIED